MASKSIIRLTQSQGGHIIPSKEGTMIRFPGGKVFILLAVMCMAPTLPRYQDQADLRLATILKKSAEYCRRLDKAALDFVCLEEVTEFSRYYTPHTDVYLYDYQFIRKNEETQEKRNLIKINGKKADVMDSSLHAVMFHYKNVLFGPVGLLSSSWQAHYKYQLMGEDTIHNEKTVVVDVSPRDMVAETHLYGKIWIKEDDGSILKIVWDQRSLGNFRTIEEWAKAHESEPQITSLSEYGFEKNGLRFPSRSYTKQAYIRKNKQKYVSAEISILYKDYKFFTVETEIIY